MAVVPPAMMMSSIRCRWMKLRVAGCNSSGGDSKIGALRTRASGVAASASANDSPEATMAVSMGPAAAAYSSAIFAAVS